MKMLNTKLLMSNVNYFDDQAAINPFMDDRIAIDRQRAQYEHDTVRTALESAGVAIVQVSPPVNCQDGVYTANWGLVRDNVAVLSTLPNARSDEESYAEQVLHDIGIITHRVPDGLHFSGQGDALPCGNYLLAGSGYRTDQAAHAFVAATLGYEVISLQTVPLRDAAGNAVINAASGWPDSFFYDVDLAIAVLRDDLIAWCPEAFVPESQKIIQQLPLEKITVSLDEAVKGFACNLVSTGATVVMSAHAPKLQAAIEAAGFAAITPEITELAKGGGYIRCTTLTLSN